MVRDIYIRELDSTEARGPFDVEKLISLAEAGQISPATYYYDHESEEWRQIDTNEELKRTVFPESKRIQLKTKKRDLGTDINKPDDGSEQVSVEAMLAAAEGDTAETRHLKQKKKWQEKAGEIAIPLLAVTMAISAANNIFPYYAEAKLIFTQAELGLLVSRPMLILGLVDALLAIFLFLSVTEIYPMLRFRMVLGIGYFGFYHWAEWFNGDPSSLPLMVAVIAASIGVYICTLTMNFVMMAIGGLAGLLGMLAYAYFIHFT